MASSSALTLSGCVPPNWLMVVPQVVTMSVRRAMTTYSMSDRVDESMLTRQGENESRSWRTGMGPRPETARAMLIMLIWLAGP